MRGRETRGEEEGVDARTWVGFLRLDIICNDFFVFFVSPG